MSPYPPTRFGQHHSSWCRAFHDLPDTGTPHQPLSAAPPPRDIRILHDSLTVAIVILRCRAMLLALLTMHDMMTWRSRQAIHSRGKLILIQTRPGVARLPNTL